MGVFGATGSCGCARGGLLLVTGSSFTSTGATPSSLPFTVAFTATSVAAVVPVSMPSFTGLLGTCGMEESWM